MRFIIYELLYNNENKDNVSSLSIKEKVPDLHTMLRIENNKFIFDYKKIESLKEIFLKTHFSYTQIKQFPINKIIIILRNPLDVFASLINYYDIETNKIAELVDFFCENQTLPRFKNFPNWQDHLESWTNSGLKYCLIKYADLLGDFDNQILKISKFLNVKVDNNKIQIIKKNTSFQKLKKIENFERNNKLNSFFNDAMGLVKNSFMNVGKNNYYSSLVNQSQIQRIESSFSKSINKYNL